MRPIRQPVRPAMLGLFSVALLLSGCAEFIPKIELRDDYMGKRLLQPSRIPGEIERDAYGNPVLPKQPAAPR
jgi:hypothetical protein